MDLAALIEKLGSAPEGSPELDAHVAVALRIGAGAGSEWLDKWEGPFEARDYGPSQGWLVVALYPPGSKLDGHAGNWRAKPFTSSLDHALTLIEDRWTDYSIEVCRAKFATPDPAPCCAWIADGDMNNPKTTQIAANAATPALAIALVALKARASLTPQS